jgi:hypothetical protein
MVSGRPVLATATPSRWGEKKPKAEEEEEEVFRHLPYSLHTRDDISCDCPRACFLDSSV